MFGTIYSQVASRAHDEEKFDSPGYRRSSNRQGRFVDEDVSELLEKRLGRLHAKLRLGIEADHEAQVFGQGINYFHPENLTSSHFVIRTCLLLSGLYGRGRRNAAQVEIRRNRIKSARIPKAFDGYRILHLSDFHVEMSEDALVRSSKLLQEMDYDACVLTGDYR